MQAILRHVETLRQRHVEGRSSARLRWAMLHPENERKQFGTRLARVRAEAGYTLASAAEALTERGFKISGGTIGAWETGRNVPDALALRWLARLYQVPIDLLFSDMPAVSMETIQLAAKLKAVVLDDTSSNINARGKATSPHTARGARTDELFNLTNGMGDARNKSRGAKMQGSSAGAKGAGGSRGKR